MTRTDGIPHPRPARGALKRGRRQLVILIDQETFDEVRSRAARDNTSVTHMLRLLIEWGLMADADLP